MAYQPAVNTTTAPGLAHLAAIFYKKKGLDRLQKKFHFRQATFEDSVPKQSGRTVQWFRYSNFGANTTQTVEGTVGTSQSMTSHTVAATVSQYSAFINVSDLLVDTAIDPVVQNASELLGYQGGYTVDTITRNVIDAESASTNQAVLDTYLRVADLRAAAHVLEGNDVERFENGLFFVILHPFARFDLVNDPSANGLADIFKRQDKSNNPLFKMEDRNYVTSIADCEIFTSTNVFQGTSPNTYRVYVFGKGGVGSVDLEGRGPSNVVDPTKQRFRIKTIRPSAAGDLYDPEGVIGAAVSYNFIYAGVVVDGPAGIGGTYRYRTLDPQSTLA